MRRTSSKQVDALDGDKLLAHLRVSKDKLSLMAADIRLNILQSTREDLAESIGLKPIHVENMEGQGRGKKTHTTTAFTQLLEYLKCEEAECAELEMAEDVEILKAVRFDLASLLLIEKPRATKDHRTWWKWHVLELSQEGIDDAEAWMANRYQKYLHIVQDYKAQIKEVIARARQENRSITQVIEEYLDPIIRRMHKKVMAGKAVDNHKIYSDTFTSKHQKGRQVRHAKHDSDY
jgi:hypothetical protein